MFNPIHPEPAWPDASEPQQEARKSEQARLKEDAGKEAARPPEPRKADVTRNPLAAQHGGDTVGGERFDW